jgi:DNA-binding MarR family transcriptional regulator
MTRREEYALYLRSDHWRETRKAALKRAGHKCQLCTSNRGLQVHHRTYERLGQELPQDLTVLCATCHENFHTSPGDNSNGQLDDAAKARSEGRRQTLLVLLYCRPLTYAELRQETTWKSQTLGLAVGGLEARGLIERLGSKAKGTWHVTDEGRRWARDILRDPEPAYRRLPEDPRQPPSKASERAYYRLGYDLVARMNEEAGLVY